MHGHFVFMHPRSSSRELLDAPRKFMREQNGIIYAILQAAIFYTTLKIISCI